MAAAAMRPGPPSPSRRRPPRRQQHPSEGPRIHHHQFTAESVKKQAILLLMLLVSGPCLALVEPGVLGDYLQQRLDQQQRSLASRSTATATGISSWSEPKLSVDRTNRKSKNLTIGYLTAIKGGLKDRQGLAISGAMSMALDEVRIFK